MIQNNNFTDDPLSGINLFYQHGVCRYYLTPRQFEQLKWREEIVRRRRVADALVEDDGYDHEEHEEYNYSSRRRKHRRRCSCDKNVDSILDLSVSKNTTLCTRNRTNNSTNVVIVNESTTRNPFLSIRKQKECRIKDEEDERTNLFMSMIPTFYQICTSTNGSVKRIPMPIVQQEKPCHKYMTNKKVLPLLREDKVDDHSILNKYGDGHESTTTYNLHDDVRE